MGILLDIARGTHETPPESPLVFRSELRALVDRVADYHGFTDEQRREAFEIALSDRVAALECFRALVAEIPRWAEGQA